MYLHNKGLRKRRWEKRGKISHRQGLQRFSPEDAEKSLRSCRVGEKQQERGENFDKCC